MFFVPYFIYNCQNSNNTQQKFNLMIICHYMAPLCQCWLQHSCAKTSLNQPVIWHHDSSARHLLLARSIQNLKAQKHLKTYILPLSSS